MIIIQLILYCLFFTLMVKLAVRSNGINALYFYPKPVQERALAIGFTTREKVNRDMKIFMPIKFRNTLGYGWNVEFPECPKDTFSMVTHSCIYHQIFSKYGMPEMTAVFWKVDDILYGELPRAEFLYTEQIGRGGSMCDYTFKKR